MIDWLDPVRAALAEADGPVRWFVRDDDGGWEDAALVRLLDRAAAQGVSVDIAVIPMALSAYASRSGDAPGPGHRSGSPARLSAPRSLHHWSQMRVR